MHFSMAVKFEGDRSESCDYLIAIQAKLSSAKDYMVLHLSRSLRASRSAEDRRLRKAEAVGSNPTLSTQFLANANSFHFRKIQAGLILCIEVFCGAQILEI